MFHRAKSIREIASHTHRGRVRILQVRVELFKFNEFTKHPVELVVRYHWSVLHIVFIVV